MPGWENEGCPEGDGWRGAQRGMRDTGWEGEGYPEYGGCLEGCTAGDAGCWSGADGGYPEGDERRGARGGTGMYGDGSGTAAVPPRRLQSPLGGCGSAAGLLPALPGPGERSRTPAGLGSSGRGRRQRRFTMREDRA